MITFLCWVLAFLLADAAWKSREARRRAAAMAVGSAVLIAASLWLLPNLLYLGKVAGRLAMPTGIVWLGLAALAGGSWVRRNQRQAAAFGVGFVLFTLLGNAPLGGAMLASLEANYVSRDRFTGEPLDAVFVLGGSTGQSSAGNVRLADAGDRLLTAARVFKQRQVGKVVVSGSSIPGIGERRDVAHEASMVLVDMGVPLEAIVEIPEPVNSSQEVTAYKAMTSTLNWRRLGIITSAWHMRRVERLCAQAGLEAEPIPADFRGDPGWDGLLSLIPDANGFVRIQRASWEYLGAALGR